MPRPFRPLLGVLLLAALPLPGRAQPAAPADLAAEDRQTLEAAKVGTDGPGLLSFFRRRTPTDQDRDRAGRLIRQLSDDAFAVRQKAADGLVALGLPALPTLRAALAHPDEEVRQRAAECIQAIDPSPRGALAGAAARRLRVLRPAGAVAGLLAYLPAADDPATEEEVLASLVVLGVRDGRADPALAAALHDPAPERRAAAALVLGRSGTAQQRAAVRGLLTDADPRVRFRAAQGLLAGRDRDALPALIALLTDGPPEVAEQAEDLLCCAAGDRLPPRSLGATDASRKLCRGAWEGWWNLLGRSAPLAARDVDVPLFNPTLQTRTAVRQLFDALGRSDVTQFERVTDVPFLFAGGQTFTTREQLDRLCLAAAFPGRPPPPAIGRVVSVEAYVQTLPADQRPPLLPLRQPENRVVYVAAPFGGMWNRSAVIVRVAAGRARVIGFGAEQASDR